MTPPNPHPDHPAMSEEVSGGVADHRVVALIEFGMQANGTAVMTCGPHTGHIFQPVAFCKDSPTASLLANAPAVLAVLDKLPLRDPALALTDCSDCGPFWFKAGDLRALRSAAAAARAQVQA